tara:strand:+ start:194 stop:496 length:303 start_codon:yes stop_codon:yes gene_type:complete
VEEDFATGKSIIARENLVTTNKNRSSKVTTLLLGTTDKQLAMLKERQDTFGKDARKEIKRRKMIGFWDGTNAVEIDSKEVIDADLDQKEEYVYAPGVRRT